MHFFVAFGIVVVLTPVAARLGTAVRLLDRPRGVGLKVHRGPIPATGGVAVMAGFFATLMILDHRLPLSLLGAVALAGVVGLLDDVRPLPPWIRIQFLLGAGAVLLLGRFRLEPLGLMAAPGVILLALVTANAVNILDGLDGLAGGVVAIAALAIAALAATYGGSTALGLALGGALGGFLLWNRPPARVFLGNSGAYATGIVLAALATIPADHDGWRGVLAAGVALGVLALETAFTVLRRVESRRPVFEGDRGHSYDRLAAVAGSTGATVVFWAVGGLVALLSLAVAVLPLTAGVVVVAACAGAAGGAAAVLHRRGSRMGKVIS